MHKYDCNCGIALRINSTLACKAISKLYKYNPTIAKKLIKETNEHAHRLRVACDLGNHGPHAKP